LTTSGGAIDYPARKSLNPGGIFAHDLVIHPFTLQPEMTAYAVIVFNGAWITEAEKKTCVKWTALAVTPPDEQGQLAIPYADEACIYPLEIGPLDDHPP
jgi:hypothetical protein